MSQVLRPLAAVAAIMLLGLGSALIAVRSSATLDATTIGSWQAWPRAGTDEWDPYSQAHMARAGELPLGTAEGLTFTAWADRNGAPLVGACEYQIVGQTPQTRLWTIEIQNADGTPLDKPVALRAIGSDSIVRRADDTFLISVAARPVAGNWLSVEGVERLRVVLRLYDTPIRNAPFTPQLMMPDIIPQGCL